MVGPGFAYDAPGNIGRGREDEITASFSLPLERLGVAGGLVKGEVGYRRTSVVDPTTGRRRPISGEPPVDGALHFTQDRPAAGFRWGSDLVLATDAHEYRFDEIRRTRIDARLSVFAEYRPSPGWTLRAYAENLTSRHVERDRAIYPGARDVAPLGYVEVRDLATRPLIGLLARRTIG